MPIWLFEISEKLSRNRHNGHWFLNFPSRMTTDMPGSRWKKSDGAWLALAVLVHASLLLLPLRQVYTPENSMPGISIQLTHFSTLPVPAPVLVEPETPDSTPSQVESTVADNVVEADQASIPLPVVEIFTPTTEPIATENAHETPMTTARLIHFASLADLGAPLPETPRAPGLYAPRELPANWRSGMRLPGADNLFDGMAAPAQTEVADQWLAADGSHNVVMNLPNGETVCGRVEAWDPMHPLFEHVMMYRTCGGGGKRTFSMAARESILRKSSEE